MPERHNLAGASVTTTPTSELDRAAPAMSNVAASDIPRLIRRMERDHAAEVSLLKMEVQGMRHEVTALRADLAAAMRAAMLKPGVPPARPTPAPVPPAPAASAAPSGVRPVPPAAFAVPTALAREVEQLRGEVRSLRARADRAEAGLRLGRRGELDQELAAEARTFDVELAEERPSEVSLGPELRAQLAALDRRVQHGREAADAAKAAAEEAQAAIHAQLRTTRLLAERLGVGPVLLGRPRPDVGLGEEAESLAAGIAHAWRRQKATGRCSGASEPGRAGGRVIDALRRKADGSTARGDSQTEDRGRDSAPATLRAAVAQTHGPDVLLIGVEGIGGAS